MWSSIMRKLIQKCYLHHKSGFLLEFSRKLMVAAQDTNKIKVIDNGDGTRSMRSAVTNKLLVTFLADMFFNFFMNRHVAIQISIRKK